MYFNKSQLRYLFLFSLSLAGFSLPLSEWLLSVSLILLLISAFPGADLKQPLRNKVISSLLYSTTLLFMVRVIWMVNTSNIHDGLVELRLGLPLLVIPFALAVNKPVTLSELKILLASFISGVLISSIAGVIINYDEVQAGMLDSRELSLFVSHIRLALMTLLSIHAAIWLMKNSHTRTLKIICFTVASWMVVFLFLLFSITGIILLLFTLPLVPGYLFRDLLKRRLMWVTSALTFFIFSILALLIINEYRSFYKPSVSFSQPYDSLTASGNPYEFFNDRADRENGNLVWIYICEKELEKEWNNRSRLDYDSLDKKGQELKYTLVRYLASTGERRDSAGVARLTSRDIEAIESGIANRLFISGKYLKAKIYSLIWQIDYYRIGGNPSGHSITQRMLFYKTGFEIFKQNILFGTGTGDVRDAFRVQYEKDDSRLKPGFRLLSHNQYLTFLIQHGLAGFLIICIALVYPVLVSGRWRSYLPLAFFIMVFLSMLWEDTLETHTGITFFAYFYPVFILCESEKEK
ncbi:MAG: O-antigen ligase family protein [Bacteroidales bacterium]